MKYIILIWISLLSLLLTQNLVAEITIFQETTTSQNGLTLEQAVTRAYQQDPWLKGNLLRQQSLEQQRTVAGELPDPKVSIGLANVPVDSFDLNQEGMTQLKLEVMQSFPRGDSRALKQSQLLSLSAQHPYQRADRKAKVRVTVAHLWLEVYRAVASIKLIEADRELFDHLVNVVQSHYSAAIGKTRQQDLVRAQLERTRLEDRLIQLRQQEHQAWSQLEAWLETEDFNAANLSGSSRLLAKTLPEIELKQAKLFNQAIEPLRSQDVMPFLVSHPAIQAIEQKIKASKVAVELAKQNYKPQWGVTANYGYRSDDINDQSRDDFLSAGITFDLPLFTTKRQDPLLQSTVAQSRATQTEKTLALRSMLAALMTTNHQLQHLTQRESLYQSRLLAEMHEQATASLTAYTHDDGDFAEAVRARIAELNAQIDALNIRIERLKAIVQMNYFFITDPKEYH